MSSSASFLSGGVRPLDSQDGVRGRAPIAFDLLQTICRRKVLFGTYLANGITRDAGYQDRRKTSEARLSDSDFLLGVKPCRDRTRRAYRAGPSRILESGSVREDLRK